MVRRGLDIEIDIKIKIWIYRSIDLSIYIAIEYNNLHRVHPAPIPHVGLNTILPSPIVYGV